MRTTAQLVVGLILTVFFGAAWGQSSELMVYPNAGQDQEQQDQDNFQCYGWARDQSGFDPMAPPTATRPPPEQEAQQGGAGRGAVRGAAVGTVVGRSDGAKKGAAAGAGVGGMRRQDQKRKEQQKQQQWEQEQAQIYQQGRTNYNRAYAACMEGRGYTVR